MDVYHFSEQPYHHAWGADVDSLRVTLPNRLCDPQISADLINERLDEWQLCDELGLNIMINEHHSSATCLSASATIPLAMLARQTRRARLLGLGFPIALRPDPVRLAEEIAYIDVVSRGRLEIGFVKGAPYEISPSNANPVKITPRFWDAHDLVLRALTDHDGPFNWESEWYHFRQVNIWPRPYQQPRPRVWITGGSIDTARQVAARQHVLATILAGWNAKKLYDAYRVTTAELGLPAPGPDRFAYTALMGVGRTREEGYRRLMEIAGYFRTTSIVGEAFVNPPGYMSARGNAEWLRRNQVRGRAGDHFPATTRDGRTLKIGSGHGTGAGVTPQDMIDAAIAFTGTPDDVYEQIVDFVREVGGVGNLIIMGHGGELSHAETVGNLTLFAQEVLPRLKELDQSEFAAAADERTAGTAAAAR
ncbi:LLM class flavin-dependent oxidoreductase [Pseudonocardia thermophila]|jgi:Coenzyme F420-dependent N5,N10-methylene tetrahydromethanopterin reductase and related flavin-dependent oxidoreductases|uniref:LLM class flavin-dependent oxidoreductase n=1 Tax=Pseudonocardia thermophila TaxID=1848 RepID=UPI00248E335A|nr:LLM class flavin-dependent oxidoreductase [Pseudonocardia thermophila]